MNMKKTAVRAIPRLRPEHVKDGVDILKLATILTDIEVTPNGTGVFELEDRSCPFGTHEDAFKLYGPDQEDPDRTPNTFYCFSCCVGGDAIDLLRHMDKLPFGAALKKLQHLKGQHDLFAESHESTTSEESSTYHANCDWELMDAAAAYYAEQLSQDEEALRYQAQQKGHAKATLLSHGVGFSNGGLSKAMLALGYSRDELLASGLAKPAPLSDRHPPVDVLPQGSFVYAHRSRENRVCDFTFKWFKKEGGIASKQWRLKSCHQLGDIRFYGEHTLAQSQEQTIAVVEGENDLLSVLEAGWQGAVLATNGSISRQQIARLVELSNRPIVTFFDHDKAGHTYREKVAAALPAAKHYMPPVEGSDVDDYLKRGGGSLPSLMMPENEWQAPQTSTVAKGACPGIARGQVTLPADVIATLSFDEASDLRNSELLLIMLGGQARFVSEHDNWAVCLSSGHWVFKHGQFIMAMAKKVGLAWRQRSSLALEAKEAHNLISYAKRCESTAGIKAMIELAKFDSDTMTSITQFDTNPNLLGLQNGCIELDTLTFRKLSPADYVSKRCSAEFQQAASCPVWESFLWKVVAQPSEQATRAYVEYLQRVCGSALLGVTARRPFFFIYGPSGSGKSVFTNTLRNILGDYAKALSPKALMLGRNTSNDVLNSELASLPGVRAVIVPEAGDENCFNDELLKAMTGGDPIKARALYHEAFEFVCGCILIFVGNSQPSSSTSGPAFMGRIKVIGFEHAIAEAERDESLPDKLKAEAPGILLWMLEGARQLRESGWQEPETVIKATQRYRQNMDSLSDFFEESVKREPSLYVSKRELYQAYKKWALDNGYIPVKSGKLSSRMEEQGFTEIRPGGGARCWQGIALTYGCGIEDRYLRQPADAKDQQRDVPDYPL